MTFSRISESMLSPSSSTPSEDESKEMAIRVHECGPQVIQETFHCLESIDKKTFDATWIIETFPDQIKASKQSNYNESESVYDIGGILRSLSYRIPSEDKTFLAIRQDLNVIAVQAFIDGVPLQKTYQVESKGHWIQQPLLGFKQFVLSKNQTLPFFFIHPEKLHLFEGVAKKIGREKNLIKIETRLNPISWIHKAMLWMDPETGLGKKVECPPCYIPLFGSIPHTTEIFFQTHPLLESERL